MSFTLEEMKGHYGEELGTQLYLYYKETDEQFDEFFRQRSIEILEAQFNNEPEPMGLRQTMDLRAKHIEGQRR